jgi:hypothetical protein
VLIRIRLGCRRDIPSGIKRVAALADDTSFVANEHGVTVDANVVIVPVLMLGIFRPVMWGVLCSHVTISQSG